MYMYVYVMRIHEAQWEQIPGLLKLKCSIYIYMYVQLRFIYDAEWEQNPELME